MAPRRSSLYLLIAAVSRPLLRLVWRYNAQGLENLPQGGGFVLAAGHNSNFDPFPLAIALTEKHFVRFMAKSELFWWPLGPILVRMGGFKVRRGEGRPGAPAAPRRPRPGGNVVAMFAPGDRASKKGLQQR